MEDVLAKTILTELREFRKENEKRWEENNKCWERNEKRWEEKFLNSKYNEILENQYKSNKEILLLKRELETQKARMNFQNVRINSLEKWRDSLGGDFIN